MLCTVYSAVDSYALVGVTCRGTRGVGGILFFYLSPYKSPSPSPSGCGWLKKACDTPDIKGQPHPQGGLINSCTKSPTFSKNTSTYHYSGRKIGPLPIKTHPYSILQVPTTQLAKMSIDLKFVELAADVLEIFFIT